MTRTRFLLAAVLLTLGATSASAQVGMLSTVQAASLRAKKASALTVTINSGATQSTDALADNAATTFATPVSITTAWDLNGASNSVSLIAYFATTAALTDTVTGTNAINVSQVKGRVATGAPTAFTAFTGNAVGGAGVNGTSLTLFSETLTNANRIANRTDDLELQIDLTGASVPAGTYTGTLNLRAVVQ